MAWNSGDNGGNGHPQDRYQVVLVLNEEQALHYYNYWNDKYKHWICNIRGSSATGSPSVNFTNNGSASALATITKSGAETAVSV